MYLLILAFFAFQISVTMQSFHMHSTIHRLQG